VYLRQVLVDEVYGAIGRQGWGQGSFLFTVNTTACVKKMTLAVFCYKH